MKVSISLLAVALAVPAAGVAACGDDDGPMPPQACIDAIGQSSTDFVETKIFNSCTFSSCHDASGPAGDLDLTPGNAVANTVGVASKTTGAPLVVAGDPDASYLLVIMDHISGEDLEGRPGRRDGTLPAEGTMPLGLPLLCLEKRDAVAAWIAGLP